VVRGDGYCLGEVEGGLGPEPVLCAFDAEVGHLAFDDAGVGASVFAVESIRRWWNSRGRADYPDADRLLITADCGGSNSYRYRLWKAELAAFAAETGLTITVCHFPPATSKWNKIEHRLFSHITMNWRGRPLTSHEVVVNSIAATHTRTGLHVHAELDTGTYPIGISVSREYVKSLPITAHEKQHGPALPHRTPRKRPRTTQHPAPVIAYTTTRQHRDSVGDLAKGADAASVMRFAEVSGVVSREGVRGCRYGRGVISGFRRGQC
jgi:hypothetical protein